MVILSILFSIINPDPCKIGGLMPNEEWRGLYIADPDRLDLCPVLVDSGPTWTWGDGGG